MHGKCLLSLFIMEKHNELTTHNVRMAGILNDRNREVGGKLGKGRGRKRRGRGGGSQGGTKDGREEEKQMLTRN